MYVDQIADLFYTYCNEADRTFLKTDLSGQGAALYLRNGYDEYRSFIDGRDPLMFLKQADYNFTSQSTIDLASGANGPQILGPIVTQAPLQNIVAVYSVDPTTGVQKWPYKPARTMEELTSIVGPYALIGIGLPIAPYYLLQGTLLNFGRNFTDICRVYYNYYPSKPDNPTGIDWTKQAAGDAEVVDDLRNFHRLIALYALRDYFGRDQRFNVQLMDLMQREEARLGEYLERGRSRDASALVSLTY